VEKEADSTVIKRVPGMGFGTATAIRGTAAKDPLEHRVGASIFEHVGVVHGDISKYKTPISGQRKVTERERFTPLMWNKGYDVTTTDACLVQDAVSPGPGRYQIEQFPVVNSNEYSMKSFKPPVKFSQKDLAKSPYARATNKLVHSSSFATTVQKGKKPRNDRMSYMMEKGWGQVNDTKTNSGHPVFFEEWDKESKRHVITSSMRAKELQANQADIGQTYSQLKWAPVATGGTLKYAANTEVQ
jgi:hypothetical protein